MCWTRAPALSSAPAVLARWVLLEEGVTEVSPLSPWGWAGKLGLEAVVPSAHIPPCTTQLSTHHRGVCFFLSFSNVLAC